MWCGSVEAFVFSLSIILSANDLLSGFDLKGVLKTTLGSPLCNEIHHYLAFQALPFTSAFYSLSTCAVCPQRHTSSSVMPILLADWLHCQ